VKRSKEVGVDGVLMLDLPPEEGGEYKQAMDASGLDTVFLVTPTTRDKRIALLTELTTGFVYYVSRTGVTGEREHVADALQEQIDRIRAVTDKPIAVGFGIAQPDQVAEVAAIADAAVVGSAIVRRIGEYGTDVDLVSKVGSFVGALTAPLKEGAHGG